MSKHIEIWTDGACSPNPGQGGYGFVIKTDKHQIEGSRGYVKTTNNRMEMMAVLAPLRILGQKFVDKDRAYPITVFSDSKYVTEAFNQGWIWNWEKKKWKVKGGVDRFNTDLWKQLIEAGRELTIDFVWVKGHAGNELNEVCDQLAVTARECGSLNHDTGYQ